MPESTSYCLHCKKKTVNVEPEIKKLKGKRTLISKCKICGHKKYKFLKKGEGCGCGCDCTKQKRPDPDSGPRGGDIVDTIGKLVGEVHLRTLPSKDHPLGQKYSFCGPGTRLDKRLGANDEPLPWSRPLNKVDNLCYKHDLAYRDKAKEARQKADQELLGGLDKITSPTNEEMHAIRWIRPIIKTKGFLGLGMDS